MLKIVGLACFVLVEAGCAGPIRQGTGNGRPTAAGFDQQTFGWRLNAPKTGWWGVLGADWQIDNWYMSQSRQWTQKDSPGYVAAEVPPERSQTIAKVSRTSYIFDLKYVNVKNNGVVWAQTRALPIDVYQREPTVLLENYASSLAGTGTYAQSTVFGTETSAARTYTTFVTEREESRLGPNRAVRGTIEIAQMDKLALDRRHRDAKLRIVLAKFWYLAPYSTYTYGAVSEQTEAWPVVRVAQATFVKRAAVILIGYYNDVENFDASLPAFHSFVESFQFPSTYPFEAPRPATPAAPAAPPGPASEPEKPTET